jgi:hypothetical protein
MSRLEYLRDQEARARRLAGAVTDEVTIERFLEFAAACRQQITAMSEGAPDTGVVATGAGMLRSAG